MPIAFLVTPSDISCERTVREQLQRFNITAQVTPDDRWDYATLTVESDAPKGVFKAVIEEAISKDGRIQLSSFQ